MNRWLTIDFTNNNHASAFTETLNKCIIKNSDRIYFKVFTPKAKETKYKTFYIADEGSSVIRCLEKYFTFSNDKTPDIKLIARVAGSSADKDWMLINSD